MKDKDKLAPLLRAFNAEHHNIYECFDCGHEANINYMDVNCATDADPNPVVSCSKCGGCCEQRD